MATAITSVPATWYLLLDTLMYVLRLASEYHQQRPALVQLKGGATLWRGSRS